MNHKVNFLIILTIFLTGNFSAQHQLIVNKYSNDFSDVKIKMVNKITNNCSLGKPINDKTTAIGCTFHYPNKKVIEISNNKKYLYDFERVLLHELGHYLGIMNENEADRFAKQMMK